MNACRLSVYTGDLNSLAIGYDNNFFVGGTSIDALAWAPSDYLFTIASAPLSQIGGPFALTVWDAKNTQKPQYQLAKFNLSHSLTQDSTVVFNPLAIASHNMPLTMAISTGDGISICDLDLSGPAPHWKEDRFQLKFKNPNLILDYAGPLTWSPDGQKVAGIRQSLDNPTTISIWNIQNQTSLDDRALPPSAKTALISLAWNPAPSSSIIAAGGKDGKVYVWDSLGSTLPQSTCSPPTGIKGQIQELAWSADGQWLAAAYNDLDATILVWKM
jgi:WD40 repeat protein